MDEWKIWTAKDARSHVRIPKATDDKYSRGVLGVIAGSDEYPGAAVLACGAALGTGIGMIRYSGTEKSQMLVLGSYPEVVTQPGKVQAWAIGSGVDPAAINLSREEFIEETISTLDEGTPILLDAGGLKYLAKSQAPTIITPHFRELAKLLTNFGIQVTEDEIKTTPHEWCRRAATELGVCVLLKGSTTYIATDTTFIRVPETSSWLATAGTGDVLAGIIGALLATHSSNAKIITKDLANLAATGVFIHSQAATRASSGGPISASSLLREIPNAVRELVVALT